MEGMDLPSSERAMADADALTPAFASCLTLDHDGNLPCSPSNSTLLERPGVSSSSLRRLLIPRTVARDKTGTPQALYKSPRKSLRGRFDRF